MTSLLGKSKQIIGVHFQTLFMAALWNRAGHYIFMLWFLSSSSIYLLFFLAWSQRPHIGCLPYFDTWCGLSANLECKSERAVHGSLKTQDPKNRQKLAIWAPSHNFVGLYLCN